ncbi:MAG: cupin domain-containing protein [bacterium]|nr:cupin domain-containing protein [bacterium]
MIVKDFRDVEAQSSNDVPGVALRWVVGSDDGAPRFAMRVVEVQPGNATPHHEHWWEHEVYVLSGKGVVKGGDQERPIEEGSAVYVPGDEKHQFVNTGDDVLRFICVVPHTDND